MLAVDPDAIAHLRGTRTVALVSGTNGKTTTSTLLAAAAAVGGEVATSAGANLATGIVTTLAGAPSGATVVLEVDEAVVPRVIAEVRPDVVLLLNLSRDQLDRYGEVRMTGAAWRRALTGFEGHVVANADDPLIVGAASIAERVTWVAAGMEWTDDAGVCVICGGRIVDVTAEWHCEGCGLTRPHPDFALAIDSLVAADGDEWPLALRLPGRCNLANAAMAVAGAAAMGVAPGAAVEAVSAVADVAGRYRVVDVGESRLRLLLAKNPAGWLETFDLLQPPPASVTIVVAAEDADGRDPSWLWDVPFERLAGRRVFVSGGRKEDVAVRLHYAGVEYTELDRDPEAAIRQLPPGDGDVVANYTPFRRLIGVSPRAPRG